MIENISRTYLEIKSLNELNEVKKPNGNYSIYLVNPNDFSLDELEFLIRMIGSSNFKGNDLMFIYDLVNKLQNLYLDKKGV